MKPNGLGEIDGSWTERPEFCPTRGLSGSLNKHAAANLPRKERRANETPVPQAQSKLLPFGGSLRGGFGRRAGRCGGQGRPAPLDGRIPCSIPCLLIPCRIPAAPPGLPTRNLDARAEQWVKT